MKVLILSKALAVGTYQHQLELLAQEPGVAVVAVVPPSWRESAAWETPTERPAPGASYRLLIQPIARNGDFHLYTWRGLGRLLRREQPDILHVDEESFNLATFQAMVLAVRLGIPALFFNWANIERRLPPPFSWIERYNLRHAACAIAGNQEAADLLRRKSYQGKLRVIPQIGVDAERFTPLSGDGQEAGTGTVGYAGRLVPQKGLLDLLEAVAGLPEAHLLIVGGGGMEAQLRQRAAAPDLQGRVEFTGRVPSVRLPEVYRQMDLLVLPSRTTATWKEQFGRVLIEAMASGVPVVGSSSGEIPHVIGAAGLVFPEGNVPALRSTLAGLLANPARRAELGRQGRARVLEHYTQQRIVQQYLEVYREMAQEARAKGQEQEAG